MTAEEIQQMINTKGAVAKTTFKAFFTLIYTPKKDWDVYYTEDSIATLCYNCTILMMQKILDNPDFFEKRCKVKERNRIRMRKDLEKMSHIDYPNDYTDFDLGKYENAVIDSLPFESM